MKNHITRGVLISGACALVFVGMLLSPASASTRLVTDPQGDVVIYKGPSLNVAATECTPATSGYEHIDLISMNITHQPNVGYTITVAVAGAFNVSSFTEINLYVKVNGSFPSGGPESPLMPEGSYTFRVQIQASSGEWFNRTFFSITDQLQNGIITGEGQFQFTIGLAQEDWINGTEGFLPDISAWGVFGFAKDRVSDDTFAVDLVNWENMKAILESGCNGAPGIPGYEVLVILAGIAISIVLVMARKWRR